MHSGNPTLLAWGFLLGGTRNHTSEEFQTVADDQDMRVMSMLWCTPRHLMTPPSGSLDPPTPLLISIYMQKRVTDRKVSMVLIRRQPSPGFLASRSGLPFCGRCWMQIVIWNHRWELGARSESTWTKYSQRNTTVPSSKMIALANISNSFFTLFLFRKFRRSL